MDNNGTKGVNLDAGEFISTVSDTKQQTETAESYAGDTHGLKYVPGLIKYLEEHFSFTALLVCVIGYIIIAAFGNMKSIGEYFGYIGFLSISFIFYKVLHSEQRISSWNKFFVLGFFILLAILLFKYEIKIISWLKYLIILIKK